MAALFPAGLGIARPATLLSLRPAVIGALLTVGQVSAVFIVALIANDNFGFYPTWSDLVGQKVTFAAPSLVQRLTLDSSALTALAHAPKGRGAQLQVVFIDRRTGLSIHALAYIPAAYRGSNLLLDFPVLEVVGAPTSGSAERGFFATLDSEISSGRLPPLVAVILQSSALPTQLGPARVHDLGSLKSREIRRQLIEQLRVRGDQSAWGLLGIGSGVSVVEQLERNNPTLYGTVVDVSAFPRLARALDEVGRQLSPPLAPPLTGGATVTSRRADLRG